jgi:5-methylcytosine-specific restriction protein A
MRTEALFINGIFQSVIDEILEIQDHIPHHVMYLQPCAGSAITHVRDTPPSAEAPMLLVLSTTEDLGSIQYACEIIGWDDKRTLPDAKRIVLTRVIGALQANENGLYDASGAGNGQSVNLLHVRKMRRVKTPFSVTRLIKTVDNMPIAGSRSTSGGWTYVQSKGLLDLTG